MSPRVSPSRQTQRLPLIIVAVFWLHSLLVAQADFNYEVEKRVDERLSEFMRDPRSLCGMTANFLDFGGFPHQLAASDRDAYLTFAWSLWRQFTIHNTNLDMIYYGLEDGVFLGYDADYGGTYREPGESGYGTIDIPDGMAKYYGECVNPKTGIVENCTMGVGGEYIRCSEGCSLEKCPDDDSQRDCSILATATDRKDCQAEVKWCKKYTREYAAEGMALGFIPRTYHCVDKKGRFTEAEGEVLLLPNGGFGDCLYGDGITVVNRNSTGAYEYCGGNGQICNTTFVGGYRSRDYDPRWRGWYVETKARQQPMWSEPYPFFTGLEMGITYSQPLYSVEEGKKIFKGVLAIDYTFDGIRKFLLDAYLDSTTSVMICEDADPHYMIGSSTGIKVAKKVLASDKVTPCPDVVDAECTAVRLKVSDLSVEGNQTDAILARAFAVQKEAGFLPSNLLAVKATDEIGSEPYISQSQVYEQVGANLAWRIIVIMPMNKAEGDAIIQGSALFGVLILIGTLGFTICLTLLGIYYKRRKNRAIVQSDWRFTSLFILGCAILNCSTITLLGPNTDGMCMLRMWSFHFCFVLALAPLLVKVWRIYMLVGVQSFRRVTITNQMAALCTLPIVLTEAIILTVFSIVDPPELTEVFEMSDNTMSQHVMCAQDTNAFMIVQLLYESGLVFVGCVLAYLTRNLDVKYGESKQLLFAMYNVAFIGILFILVVNLMGWNQEGKHMLQAIGVFWGTVFGSSAFVIPRLLQSGKLRRHARVPAT